MYGGKNVPLTISVQMYILEDVLVHLLFSTMETK